MPRDLFAEIGDSPKPATKPSGGRDLFAELEKPATKPAQTRRASTSANPQVQRWQQQLAQKDAEIATFAKRLERGEFGGGRGASVAGEQMARLRGERQDILNKIEAGREVRTTGGDIAREVVNAPFRGIVNTALGGVSGGLDLLGFDDAAENVRAYRDEVTDKYKAPEAASQNELLRIGGQYGEGLGSTAPFLAGGIPVRGAKIVTGAMAGGLGADEQDARVKAAREQGIEVSEGQEVTSEILGAGVGLTELLPVPSMIGRGLGGRTVDVVSKSLGKTRGGRIIGAGIEEGSQEALAGVMQDTIERGVYNENATIGENALSDFALGAAVGGTIRGGVELVDGTTGRLRNRNPNDTRKPPAGKVETALEANAVPSQADIESPLDTGDIAAGRAGIAVAQAENEVSREFEALGLPEVGASVLVNDPETGTARGTLVDRFTAEDGTGVVIELEDGTKLREYDDVLADVGVTITPASPTAEADAIDARLAARAEAALQAPADGEGSSSPLSPSEGAPPSQSSDTGNATPSGPVSDGGAFNLSRYMARNRAAESSGDDTARASTSSATGRYQFTEGTWKQYYKLTFGNTGESEKQILAKRLDGAVQDKVMARLTADNVKAVERAGAAVTDGNVYLAHFLGANGASAVLRANPNTPVSQLLKNEQIAANKSILQGKTAGQVIAWAAKKMGGPAPDFAPTQGGGLGMGRAREDAPTIEDSDKVGPEPLAMPEPTREPIATRGREPDAQPDPADRDTAVTVTGREIGVEYRLAELDDLTASNTPDGAVNPRYPKERQPRDRSRAASLSQVENIAGNLNPRLLGRSPKAADGAPIVSPDGVVESGNGRTLALQKVYEGNADRAAAYRQFLEAEGFNTEGMNKPVLVRVRDGDLAEEDVQAFVREANARDTAGMSGTETAASDADALPGGLLDLFRGGDIDAAGNRDFVRGFMQALVPENDRANLVLKDGSIAGTLVKRIEAALLVRAIGPRAFIEKLVDADGDNIKAIGKALVDVSGPLAKLREAVRSGAVDASMDIADNIAEAVEIVERARREKRNVSDLINQRDVFSGEAVAPLTEAVLHLFFNGPRFSRPAGRERIAQRLGFYIEQAEKAAPGGGLFGESTKAQPGDILGLANEKDRAPSDGDQADLLAARPGESERDGRDGADVRADGRDGAEQRGEGALPQSGEQGASESVTRQTFGKGNFIEIGEDGDVFYEVNGFAGGTGSVANVRRTLERDLASNNSAVTDANRKAIERMLDALPSDPTPAPDIRGDEARKGWRYFTGASGSLGVPRSDMPQVRSEHRGALVNFLKGRGVQHTEETVPAAALMPTQAEFSPSKVAKAKAFTGGNRAILASAEGYVVDGHHQWMAARDQNEEIRIIRLDAPIRDLLTMVKEFPSVEGEDGKPASQDAPAEPVTTAYTLSTSKSGKGLELRGASDAQVAAIKAAGVPIPPAKKDGTLVFSKKREADVRSALEGVTEPDTPTPAAQSKPDQEPRQRPSEAELSRRDWTSMFNAAGERMRERLDAVDPNRLRPMLEAMAEGRPIVGDGDVIETINPHRAYELGYIKLDVAEDGRRSFSITDTGRDFLAGKKTVAGKGQIGENANGEPVFEDENGVRSVIETIDGVRIRLTESVGIVPGGGTYVDVSRRWDRYKTTSELGAERADKERRLGEEYDALANSMQRAKQELDAFGADYGAAYKAGPIKTRERTLKKVLDEDGYLRVRDVKDMARSAFLVVSMREAETIADAIRQRFTVKHDKGWKGLSTGYADHKMIVEIDGLMAEIQIVPARVWNAKKQGGANALYKEQRGDNGPVSAERFAELERQQQEIYSEALTGTDFESFSSSSKSASGNSASASSRDSERPSLTANPGASAQVESSRQTSAKGGDTENTAASRNSTSLNEGVSISDDVGADGSARKGVNPSKNRLVSDERAAELRARLREKLNPNRLNAGIDPELLAIGTELAVYHIEKGARRFTALSRAIAADIGVELESVRKYLRGWYNGARDMMEDSGESVAGMDDADEVGRAMRTFADWANDATMPVDADVSDRLSQGDERPGAEDGARAPQDGGAERAPRQEGSGSPGSLFDFDQGRADGGGQRSAGRPADGSAGDRAGVRDTDRVPADGRTGARAERTGTPASSVKGKDWLIEPGSLAESRKPAEKARDNLEAIRTVKRVKAEGRAATREEQAIIARYVGWGGLKNAFPDAQGQYGKGFEQVGPALRELLTDSEYETARRSIQYAHYTGETVVRSMWDMAHRLGFRGGQVFEPGMGTGNFRGMIRPDLLGATSYSGLEYDHLTADIASLLYPQSGVRQADYTATPMLRDVADLVIGNPPFSETAISSDKELGKHKFMLHDFFFAKSIEAVKPGGLLMFVTSAGTMNKVNSKARDYLADRADLVGAIRLPGNAFKENAGTEVTTDIVILRKREPGTEAADRSWTEVAPVSLPDRDGNTIQGNVNRYFIDNPDMVLGEQGMFDKLVAGARYAVRAPAGFDLAAAMAQAMDRLPAADTTNAPRAQSEAAVKFDLTTDERKEGSFYIGEGGTLMQLRSGAGVPVQAPGKGVKGGISKANQARIKKLIPIRDSLRAVYAADLAENDADASAARKALNAAYDGFVREFGPINQTTTTARAPSVVQIESARAQAREEARLAGTEWNEGSFDVEPYLERNAPLAEIARARKAAREDAKDAGRTWDEGTFDPEEVPDTIIEKRPNLDPFMADEEAYRLAAIEHYDKDTGKAAKGRIFTQSAVRLDKEPEIGGAEDALLYSLNRFGRPDVGFIADKVGLSEDEVLEKLADRLFEVPGAPGTYETAEVYLSGNVRDKLAIAQEAAASNSSLARNVRALEAVQPAPLAPSEIHAKLGMPWIPQEVIEQFGTERLGLRTLQVKYTAAVAQWMVGGDSSSSASLADWGTDRYAATKLIEAALNRQTPKVYDRDSDGKRIFNDVATQAAQDKMTAIKAAFAEWIWTDETRTAELVELYNQQYNSLVAPEFDGSYLTTPGINPSWKWRPHQGSVIARIIQTGNTYMAHEVGSGKTSAMIGAGMEMRRLGLVNKPMYVVPNHMLGQFTKEFYEQYPLAKIRVADETRFHTSRRKEFIASIAADDLDAVIITHSAFGYIPMSEEFTDRMVEEQIAELESVLSELDKQDDRITRRNIEQRKEQLEQKIKGKSKKGDQVFTFEETGVDFLFVDEAHLFRKLDYATKMGNVKGIDPNGSAMSFDLFAKTRYLEKKKPGRNLVLASGTPITNTMAELYSVSRYLQERELQARGLGHFDAWAGAYGDTVTALEQDPAGGYKPITRFAQFVNVPELSVMVRQVMDVVSAADLRKYVTLPALKGGARQTVIVEQTDLQEDYQYTLKMRMEAIQQRRGPPKPGDDILLSVIGDGRKAAIDYRLVSPGAKREAGSKLEVMIDRVFERWEAFKDVTFHEPLAPGQGYSKDVAFRGAATQMIFSDFGINGDFPVHKYIKQTLVARGVPANQIALISDYKSHVQKQRLFNDMNEGKVRVLIGSVAKMGTGVNAQKRLRAVHNMDPQWYPANDTQRNGRIIRQGNMNPEVEILDYSTKGTYDSQMWNLMAKKAKFIEGFMRGDPNMRDMEDLGEASQYEQAQAMTTSDPRVMELTEWKQELEQIQRRKAAHEREQHSLRKDIELSEFRRDSANALIPLIEQDIAARDVPPTDAFTGTINGETFDERVPFGEAIQIALSDLVKTANGKAMNRTIGEYAGFRLEGATKPGIDGPTREVRILRAGKRYSSVNVSEDPSGMVSRLTNAVGKFDRELEEEQRVVARAEDRIADYTPKLGKTFDDGGRMAELDRQILTLEATLKQETADREKARTGAKDSIPEDDLFSPAQPERSMTQRQRAELEARQQQGMARRGGQQGLGDQDGGLFSSERDQGSLFSRTADLPVVSIRAADWGKLPKEGRGRLEILRGRAKQWYAGLVGSTITSSDGKRVTFNKAGAKRSIRAGEDLLSLSRAIPAVIERGELVSSVPSTRAGMRMLHSYAARVRDENGKTVPVVVTVREAADGSFQYSLHGYQEPGDASAKADGEAVKAFTPALEGNAPSGINLFILPGEGNSTAETSADLTALREQLAALGLREKVAMRVVDTLGGVSAGRFTPGQQRLIEIATDTRQDEAFTLNHEALHALRDMGLFKDSEWKILVARAKREPGLMRSIKRRYAKLDAEGQAEESVADLFAMFQRGDFTAKGMVEKSFKMLRDVLEAIGNAFRGRGLRTAEGVMRDMASGRVAARGKRGLGGTTPRDMVAYHGGPNDHDGFDTGFIGSGEGAQAFGWGLYFASKRQIAEHYRDKLSRHLYGTPKALAHDVMKDVSGDEARAIEVLNDRLASWKRTSPEYRADGFDTKIADAIRSIEDGSYKVGRLYTVEIPEADEYLLWDRLLSEQPAKVREAIRPLVEARAEMYAQYGQSFDYEGELASLTGRDLYLEMEAEQGSDRAASLALKGAGVAGIKYLDGTSRDEGEGSYNYVVFDGADVQITAKESIPETAEALAQAGTGPTWKEKMGDTFDRWRTAMQDRYLPLLRVQQAIEAQTGKSLPENMNPYLGEELMSGRIGARLETLMEDHVRPLFDAMADEEITTDELETYLYARHAPERNARIAEINPEFNGENGSGMSNLEARAVMARIKRGGKIEAMERLADRVDRMRDMALDYRVETGLMSQEDADAWRATYEHYVPLRGFKEVEGDPASAERINRSGGGINVRGKESRAAYGRRSQADSPLAYTILQAEEAIVRGETNRTAQRFINLAKANPDEGFWEVNKVSGRRQMNPETGLVEEYLVHQLTAEDKDWTVSAKFDGKEVRVTMNRSNPTARRVADSMRNLTQHQLDWVTEHLGKLNRFLSRVNTSYNPEFVISNAMRDIQTAAVNLTGIERDGLVKGTLKDYPAALKAATKGAFRKGEGEWKRWYDEFVNEGGRVYFNQVEDIGLIKKRIEREAQLAGADKPGTKKAQAALHAKRLFFAAGDLIENMNLGVENAVRLAAYKNAREQGMTKEAAASLAKNLTVNFNRRGTMGPAMNAAYLFYNASVQGTVRLVTALRSKKARRLLYGVMVTGAAVEMLNAMASGYDDDEESYYDKIPHYEKERNLIVMMPGTKQYVKIPLPYGYNVFWEAGRTTAEIARRGGEAWKESAFNLFLTAANSFNPVGGADSLINLVAPTVMDPIVDLEMNEDFTGAPIMPEQNPFDSPEPDHNRYFSSVEPHWREIAHGLNKLSGGDDVVPGSISVSPETLEYLFGYTVGGAGRFVERIGSLPARIADPDHETSVNDFPFARKMVGQTSPWLDKGLYYDRVGQIDQAVDFTKDYLEREQFDEAAGFAERNAQILGMEPVMKAAQKEMRVIRKARRANEGAYELGKIDEAAYRAEKQVIDQAETMVITGFNTQWNRSVGYGRDGAGER